MRRAGLIAGIVVGVVILVLVGLIVAISLVPESVKRNQLIALVKNATGRDLTIAGGVGVSIFPKLGIEANNVSLSNAPGFDSKPMATMSRLAVGVRLMPLLSGNLRFEEFALIDPQIALEVDAQGKNNWTFEGQKPAEPTPSQTEPGAGRPGLKSVSLGKMQLSNGRVTYTDLRTSKTMEAHDINITVALQSLDEPFDIDGSLVWRDKKITLTAAADSVNALQSQDGTPLKVKLSSDLLNATFDGRAASRGAAHLWGKAGIDTPSIRDLSAWLAKPMGAGKGFGPFELKGDLDVNGDVTRFENASVRFDDTRGTGSVMANTGGERPYVKAALAVDTLNADLYLSATPQSAGAASGGAPSTPAAPTSKGWSEAPIDLTGLRAADADLSFKAKTIIAQGLTFTNSNLGVALKNGVLTATLSEMTLYGGGGTAKVVLDGSGVEAGLKTDLAFSSVAIEPLLRDAAKFDKLTGTGNLDLSINSRGASQKALVQNLNGNGSLKLANGAVRGINLAAMVRNLAGAFAGGASGGSAQTDFAELGGTFVITDGILHNNDLQLLNPLLRITGQGTSNLVERTVDYHFLPKAVASLEGQGGKTDLTGLSVPVRVTGSWDNLSFAPDPKGMLEGAVKGVSEALGAGQNPLKGALQGVLGQPGAKKPEGQSQGTPTDTQQKQDPAQQLLKGILGQ